MSKIGTEPELRDMDDYNTLTGEKKKIVWTVIVIGLLIGAGFVLASKVYTDKGDAIKTHDPINAVPPSKSISIK